MKCVENLMTGEIKRLSDKDAKEYVNRHGWRYVSKAAYKAYLKKGEAICKP